MMSPTMSATGSREAEDESEAVFTRVGDDNEDCTSLSKPPIAKEKQSFETHRDEMAVTARRHSGSDQE